jgi:hypothetical protein
MSSSSNGAEAQEAGRSPSSIAPSDDEAQEGGQAAAQTQPDEAEAPEGGGAEGAPLTTNGHASGRHFEVNADGAGNIAHITFFVDGGEDVVMTRPEEDSNEMLLWRLYETTRFQFRRRRTELQSAINRAHAILGAAGASSNQGRLGAATPRLAPDGRYPAPTQVEWKTKPLPERVVQQLQGTYFLKIEEHLEDRHGNPYVPAKRPDANNKLQWRGSRLADKFPHAIVSMKDAGEGVSSRSHQYICAEKNIHVTVKLMKRVEGGGQPVHVSESEVLQAIDGAYSLQQRSALGDLDNKMFLYMYLEFEDEPIDGMPVGANAFENPPDFASIFKPPESLPSYMQGEDPGYYEFKMTGGVGVCTFGFANRVTNSNLKAPYKRKRFRLVVKALNYHLVGLEGFTARSLPFMIKGVLHNDVKGNERYVMDAQGNVVDSGVADVPK